MQEVQHIDNMIKTTIDENDFVKVFDDYHRSENFTTEARRALFNYLENLSEDTGKDIELDIISLCCEYSEYETALNAAQYYGYEEGVDLEPHGSLDLLEVADLEEQQALEWLQNKTTVIEFDGGVIIEDF